MSAPMRQWIRVLSGVLVLATLSACAGKVPESGPIQYGRENSESAQENFVRALVSPPQEGADALTMVRGFLAAAAGDDGSFATARLFLAPEVRDAWDPMVGISVFADQSTNLATDAGVTPDLVEFVGFQVASIDPFGDYRPRSSQVREEFRLRVVNGELRIASLPDGLILSETDLARSYRSVLLYFPNPSKSALVPDPVYVSVRSGLSTSLVRALVRGPTRWLNPAVTTGFPKGTSLAVNSVPIEDGLAVVDLSAEATRASPEDRAIMSAQLVFTLRQLPEFRSLRITVRGSPLAVPGVGVIQPRESWDRLSPDRLRDTSVLVSSPEGLATVPIGTATPTPSFLVTPSPDRDLTPPLRYPTLSLERDYLAAISDNGALVLAPTAAFASRVEALKPTVGSRLSRPSWDSLARIWIAQIGAGTNSIWLGSPSKAFVEIPAEDLKGRQVLAMRISRDGTRLAAAVAAQGTPNGSQVLLMRVERTGTADSSRLILTGARQVAAFEQSVLDLVWSDGDQLSFLVGRRPLPAQIYTLRLDGSGPIRTGPSTYGLTLAGGSGLPLLVDSPEGTIFILREQGWRAFVEGRYPSYPG
jgi:hypothetical protein